MQGRNYPEGIGGSQVRLVLLPSKKQRRKTRVRQGTSPQYMESFLLPRVNPEDVNAMGVRLRVYLWGGRMRRERLLGEARVSFDQINLQLETTLWLTLQPPPFSSVKYLYNCHIYIVYIYIYLLYILVICILFIYKFRTK